MIEKSEIFELFNSRKFVLYSAIGILLIKLIGDFVLSYFFGSISFEDNIIWKFVTTILLFIFGYSYIKELLKPKLEAYNSSFIDNYLDDIVRLAILYGIGILLSIFQVNINDGVKSSDFPLFVFLQVFGWYYIVITYSTVSLLVKWINTRKNHRTKFFFQLFLYGYIFLGFDIFIIKALNFYLDLGGLLDFFDVIVILLFIWIGFLSFRLPFDNDWIYSLTLQRKKKLRLYSFLLSGSTIWTFFLFSNDSAMTNSINWIFPNLNYLLIYPTIIIAAYQLRIFFTTGRNYHKKSEYQKRFEGINTLTEFNKFILESNTTDRTHLLNEFMKSLATVVEVDFAWAEDYDSNDISSYRSIVNMSSNFIDSFNILQNFRSFVLGVKSTIIIPSFKELQLNSNHFFEGALAIIPIHERKKRIGTIYLGRSKTYSFTFDEVQIINTFATNYAVAIENSILLADSLEKRRFAFELQLAQGIQRKIIPQQIPQIENYSIAGISIPANELGGDYYDLVYLKNNKPTLLIADVSGKGVSAALYMSQLKGIVMSISKSTETPGELLKELNTILHLYTEKQIFITLAAITIENDSGLLKYVRAGHSPLIIKQSGRVYEIAPKGIALGIANSAIFDINFEEIEIQLEPGDMCLAYTDGFDELRNSDNLEFGRENIRKLIINSNSNQAQDLIDTTLYHIKHFINGANQFDDLTLLSIIYLGENGEDGKQQ
jgi:serine phosphatase RsbU (regulator of sigma subunit)